MSETRNSYIYTDDTIEGMNERLAMWEKHKALAAAELDDELWAMCVRYITSLVLKAGLLGYNVVEFKGVKYFALPPD